MKVIHVVPHGRPGGIGRELELLLLPSFQAGDDVEVCCLGEGGSAAERWRWAGATVDVLRYRGMFDARSLWLLARRLREQKHDLIQTWGMTALWAVSLAAPMNRASLAVRRPTSFSEMLRGVGAFDSWLLRRSSCILARGEGEANLCRAAGVSADKLVVVPPGVPLRPIASSAGLAPLILCAGDLKSHKGYYEAIWAFDILHHAHNKLELAIVGEGPERRRLEQFAAGMGLQEHVHFPGETTDLTSWLARAWLVWVPSIKDSGAGLALEAMAAGRAVIAARHPHLSEIVIHGETGILVQPRNKVALAAQTMRLLEDAQLRNRLGEAGRLRAERNFSASAFVQNWKRALANQRAA